uniref:Uncharacterized protein n=1 Tax=Arundo donax TaxID=35708 RepID=A0A0A9D0Y3_ARUDO
MDGVLSNKRAFTPSGKQNDGKSVSLMSTLFPGGYLKRIWGSIDGIGP